MQVFLIGGGWNAEIFPQTFGRFLTAAANNQKRIAIIVAEEDGADSHEQFLRFSSAFESIGLNSADSFKVIVSAEKHMTIENLNEIKPSGIFVCGGLTPVYYDSLCHDKHWLEYLFENNIPYCGFSAGASIASEKAIIGGWRREINNELVEIANENAGEDLDLLDVRNGLGLVPFAVDVHATQWGTLSRLVHAIDAEFVVEGWAIDENTLLEFDGKNVSVHGAGGAYRIRRAVNHSVIDIFHSGTRILIR
ncbi:MAG TPA: Type 1 glutamine amidotransferase-like domain-containing protein [Pyrinomonadaceae bacterium]|jgi:cyanophycinase